MTTALFVSYNAIGDGSMSNRIEQNGRTAVLLQHPKGKRWAAGDYGPRREAGKPATLAECQTDMEREELRNVAQARKDALRDICNQALQLDMVPDYVVIYVGAGGSDGAVELAANFPHDKLRFVLCDCGLEYKLGLISGHIKSPVFPYCLCECGGQRTMERLVREFLLTGGVGPT